MCLPKMTASSFHPLVKIKKKLYMVEKIQIIACLMVNRSLSSPTSCKRPIKWAATWQNQQNGCASSEDSDQPGHPPSLIRVFAVRMKKHWALSYPLSAQRRLWSYWADSQADLSLRWAHTHFVGFVMSWLKFQRRCQVRASITDSPWRHEEEKMYNYIRIYV